MIAAKIVILNKKMKKFKKHKTWAFQKHNQNKTKIKRNNLN